MLTISTLVCNCLRIYFLKLFCVNLDKNANFTYPYNASYEELANYTTDIEKSTIESVLQVNIKGCGCK